MSDTHLIEDKPAVVSITLHDKTVTVSLPTSNISTEQLVGLIFDAALASGHDKDNIIEAFEELIKR